MSADLVAEFRDTVARLNDFDRARLLRLGIAPNEIKRLCGIASVNIHRQFYEPAPGNDFRVITPVRVEVHGLTPESPTPALYCRVGPIIDLIAWHPRYPARIALRRGVATALGCIEPQHMDPAPVPIRRTVLGWLRSGCDGLVLLSPNPADRYRILSICHGGIIPEDPLHAKELRKVLEHPFAHPPIVARREASNAA